MTAIREELTVAGIARAAVLHLVEHTPLVDGVQVHTTTGVSDWSRLRLVRPASTLSSGELALWRACASMAGHDEGLTLLRLALLDEPCRRAVVDALAILCRLDGAGGVMSTVTTLAEEAAS